GEGEVVVRPPANAALYTRTSEPSFSVAGPTVAPLPTPPAPAGAAQPAAVSRAKPASGMASYVGDVPDLGHVPIAGSLRYTFGQEWVEINPSSISTSRTYVEFSGRTAYGERTTIDFYARSGDWQESDNLLSAIITAFGSPTRTVMVGGYGDFTGRMLNSFRKPRIEGDFVGHDVRAFDVVWGRASGRVVVDNGYVDVTGGLITKGKAELRADGRFSLSTPRQDGGEELNTRVRLSDWPIPDLRHAFDLDAYSIDGLAGGEYHVYGAYRRPFGYGQLTVSNGVAYREPFEHGVASLRLEGTGVRLDAIEVSKGGGTITGAAYMSWDGRYSFNADGRRIPVEQLNALKFPQAPLSGLANFRVPNANGAFQNPRYRVEFSVADLFAGDEGIGQVKGTIDVRDEVMGLQIEAASPRLAVSGLGRISMATGADADLTFTVTDTSLDPYLRTLQPQLSPFTRAVAGGTVRIVGPLSTPMRLQVTASVEQLHLSLFDYELRNDGPLNLLLNNSVVSLTGPVSATDPRPPMRLVGKDTKLALSGDINLGDEPYAEPRGALVPGHSISLTLDGDANLGILQGLFRDIRSSGRTAVSAAITGPLDKPVFSGRATISDGRIRYYSLPHSIDAINGPIILSANSIRFGDARTPLVAQVGGGAVTFGGRVDLIGFTPTQWALTASGDNLRLRYPEGFTSTVDVDLALTGPYGSPLLKGTVNVLSAVYAKTLDITPQLLVAAGAGGNAAPQAAASTAAFPLRFDVHIIAQSSLRVQSNLARLVASADLTLRGSYDHPTLLGRADVERGYANFAGKRYQVTHGAIEFRNPSRIEPNFDIETETRVRVPGQTYIVTLHLVGTLRQIQTLDVTSDPPLPTVDAWSLLFGDVRSASDLENAELRRLQRPGEAQQQILTTQLEQLLMSTATSNVSRAFERTFGLDTFQLTPSLFDAYQRLNPTARLTIGKQISDRVYLTIASSLYAPQEDVIYVLQYDQTDRVSWVLSRNENKTYSLDVRVRHTF
ncbi:MAG: translocation/assembly module TamB domain-containing protein, partial [Bacteroidales bacterium]